MTASMTRPSSDHPRIRGEHILLFRRCGGVRGSSPHTRGALDVTGGDWGVETDHPRIRGEHEPTNTDAQSEAGSSPHTRGALQVDDETRQPSGIIPAYAGSTPGLVVDERPERDHPRIRGEHFGIFPFRRKYLGSSPHTRGAQGRDEGCGDEDGIIPAYAGSTGSCRPTRPCREDHPRIRGEHPVRIVLVI